MVRIFYAHRIVRHDLYKIYEKDSISLKSLTDFLEKNKNKFIAFHELTEDKITSPKEYFVLTFDDGHKSDYELVYPLLVQYQIPALFFLTLDFINSKEIAYEIELGEIIQDLDNICMPKIETFICKTQFEKNVVYAKTKQYLKFKNNSYRRKYLKKVKSVNKFLNTNQLTKDFYMSWNEILKLDKDPLITLGAHSCSHIALSRKNIFRSFFEIFYSKLILQKKLGHTVDSFAYPYGVSDRFIRFCVSLLQFTYAFTTVEKDLQINQDKLTIPRYNLAKMIYTQTTHNL